MPSLREQLQSDYNLVGVRVGVVETLFKKEGSVVIRKRLGAEDQTKHHYSMQGDVLKLKEVRPSGQQVHSLLDWR